MLTVAAIRAAKPGAILWDTQVAGLHVRVGATKATYTLFYRTKSGRQRRPKIGNARTMSLTQARAIANKLLLAVASGGDPAGDVALSRESITFKEAADLYMKRHAVKKKPRSRKYDQWLLDRVLVPRWGAKKMAEISSDDMAALREEMSDSPVQFNRVRSLVSKLFNLAEAPGWRLRAPNTNPVKGVPRYPEKARRRYMKASEAVKIAKLLDAAEAENLASIAFIRLLILTGARPSEIASARWGWLESKDVRYPDGRVETHGMIHHPDVKTGERDIHFSPAAMSVLDALPRTTGTLTGIQSPRKLWQRIRCEAGCPDLRLYDLRRSFASVALSVGYNLSQIGELLGHQSAQTTKRYAYLVEEHKATAVARIGDAITERAHEEPAQAEQDG